MDLEKFLKTQPDLVEKLKKCQSEEEVRKLIETEVSPEDIEKIESEHFKEISDEELGDVSGGVLGLLAGAAIGIGIGFIVYENINKIKRQKFQKHARISTNCNDIGKLGGPNDPNGGLPM